MTDCINDYTAHYHWQWFCREQWRQSFREKKRQSSGAFVELVRERGVVSKPVLDCSCGLGLKTIVLKEAGLNVHGSDGCELAVEHAREFAREEGHSDIPYFVSSWADLPRQTNTRYAAIFNDALSWVYSDEEMASSLRGSRECLQPGGILAYMGALPGTDDAGQQDLLEREWLTRTVDGRHIAGLSASDGKTSVQEAIFQEKGADYVDEHHLFMVNDAGAPRVETWCLRCTLKWSWPRIEPFLRNAGFSTFATKEFIAQNGKPFHLVLAQRD